MKLDIECVRDILITLEQQPGFVKMTIHDFSSLLPQYTVNQIIYTCWRLYEGGYINLFLLCPYTSSEPIIRCIGDLTFQGHEYKLSDALKLGGSASFKAIANVAIDLGTDILKSKLKLTDN